MTKPQRLMRIYRFSELKPYYGRGKTQLQIDIANGKFPSPVKLGKRSIGWLESDLLDWQQTLVRRRNSQAS